MGAKKEEKFGPIILCGLGGVFVEVFKDISSDSLR
ncbi:MAG: acetate--CoA ligase family protein [Bacteroidetes bacterium]|nr:acetate--CoA ligase family protein [Bacteroidota bacterium]